MKDIVAAAVAAVGASVATPSTVAASARAPSARPLQYEALRARVAKPVAQLRNVFEGAEAKEHEREWIRFRQHGDTLALAAAVRYPMR